MFSLVNARELDMHAFELAPEQTRRWNMMVKTDFPDELSNIFGSVSCSLISTFFFFFFGGGGGFNLLACYPIGTLLFFLELVFGQDKGWLCLQGLV